MSGALDGFGQATGRVQVTGGDLVVGATVGAGAMDHGVDAAQRLPEIVLVSPGVTVNRDAFQSLGVGPASHVPAEEAVGPGDREFHIASTSAARASSSARTSGLPR